MLVYLSFQNKWSRNTVNSKWVPSTDRATRVLLQNESQVMKVLYSKFPISKCNMLSSIRSESRNRKRTLAEKLISPNEICSLINEGFFFFFLNALCLFSAHLEQPLSRLLFLPFILTNQLLSGTVLNVSCLYAECELQWSLIFSFYVPKFWRMGWLCLHF